MALVLSEAKELMEAHLNADLAAEWAKEQDSLLWIEYTMFPKIGVQSSVCTCFGLALAEHIEVRFDQILGITDLA